MDDPTKVNELPIATLLITRPDEECEEMFVTNGETIRVGRVKTNEIFLPDSKVSRFHAMFNISTAGVLLSDLHSLNGTFVNGKRISTPININSDDTITIGDTTIQIGLNPTLDPEMAESTIQTQTAQLKEVTVTVLVADVCSYTEISASLAPDDVAHMLKEWFTIVQKAIEEAGGEVDKYIGDCVMALWRGEREEAASQAVAAVKTAIKIQNETEKLSAGKHWPHREKHPWKCRVSLNSGSALMGTIGGGGARDYTVLGDTVNVVFRLDDAGGKLNKRYIIGPSTAVLVSNSVTLSSLGEHPIEGYVHPLELFTLEL